MGWSDCCRGPKAIQASSTSIFLSVLVGVLS